MAENNYVFSVYLVDDDDAVRDALKLLLQTTGINTITFSDPNVFFSSVSTLTPGCIVLDIRMPKISGLKLQQKLSEIKIDWPIVIISGHGDIEACRKAFTNGAIDFLSKPIDEQDLIDAVQKGFELLEIKAHESAQAMESKKLLQQLTKREHNVLDFITQGYSNKECASTLSISPRTVETHRANISIKLGTHSVVELARIFHEGRNAG